MRPPVGILSVTFSAVSREKRLARRLGFRLVRERVNPCMILIWHPAQPFPIERPRRSHLPRRGKHKAQKIRHERGPVNHPDLPFHPVFLCFEDNARTQDPRAGGDAGGVLS